MNNPIKYRRAHYGHDNTFIQFSYWGKDIDSNGNQSARTFASPSSISGTDKVVDDRFIGVVNKQEVYEGDIIDNDGIRIVVKGSLLQKQLTIGHGESIWSYSIDYFSGHGKGDNLKVIGNIHENKAP